MSLQVNSEAILPTDIHSSNITTRSQDISNNNSNNNNSNNNNSNNINNDCTNITKSNTTNSNSNHTNSSNDNANSNNNNNSNSNDNNSRTMPEVVVNGGDDFDIDEEVMSFMHSYIHSSGHGQGDEVDNKLSDQGTPDNSPGEGPSGSRQEDNMPSWDAPLKSARDNALAPDDYNEAVNGRISRQSECSIEADLHTERENMLEEEDAVEMAKRLESELTGTILALWQERLTQTSVPEDDIDIDYASESDMGSTGPPSPSNLKPSKQFIDTAKVFSRPSQNRNSNPIHPMAPVKLPLLGDGSANNNALDEIRSRLRKTKFDYSSDSRQRISDATPHLDYRSVLKKK